MICTTTCSTRYSRVLIVCMMMRNGLQLYDMILMFNGIRCRFDSTLAFKRMDIVLNIISHIAFVWLGSVRWGWIVGISFEFKIVRLWFRNRNCEGIFNEKFDYWMKMDWNAIGEGTQKSEICIRYGGEVLAVEEPFATRCFQYEYTIRFTWIVV